MIQRLCILIGIILLPSFAHASYFYTEVAPSATEFRGGSPFFGSNINSSTSLGLGYSFGFFYSLNNSPIQLQFGVVNRMDNAYNQGNSYTLLTVYPELRLQITRLFASIGATPLIYKRASDVGGLENLSTSPSSIAVIGEAGLLMPITPKFSLGISSTFEYVRTSGTLSPSPALSGNILMRFYFGFSKSSGSTNEFKGWRYPFGNQL